ncbi:MAG TPA: pyridoxal 5'-phosphate synthase glutaminase subunit PdxT [Candidatus Thalassarchaeaceae archaeon]|jgi:5'-phosphate synthase pdxT subunit|nr:pyridoxal 5'-phosphate synthase glutaminase subunit PdxT [Euryarchaeota archaeon]MDP6725560.1 pyridoxal 5'-phosphate synthase glutaminase subunit PdxT [Arenicellales bacterium]DAC51326.1 MAG TPA: pyridoxal 5'-phosphate synthase glutaminase subunit PdxT [Candidatus Poseidoniales archaeon]HIH82689.1 pyridoxal 5'-phosphate synthase glutaminase subunit PdxT [Candidatus Thalassarchaeaceae archaeon]
MVSVGLVMLQGARHAHIAALEKAADNLGVGLEIIELRTPEEITSSNLDAIVFPGGESTTMRLTGGVEGNGLLPALFSWLRANPDLPVLATCAGAILMADPQDGDPPLVNGVINRNGYGRQADSFQAELQTPELGGSFPGVFIRAPRFKSVEGAAVAVAYNQDEVVAIREGCWIAATFHPELTDDIRFHTWLLTQAGGDSK